MKFISTFCVIHLKNTFSLCAAFSFNLFFPVYVLDLVKLYLVWKY